MFQCATWKTGSGLGTRLVSVQLQGCSKTIYESSLASQPLHSGLACETIVTVYALDLSSEAL